MFTKIFFLKVATVWQVRVLCHFISLCKYLFVIVFYSNLYVSPQVFYSGFYSPDKELHPQELVITDNLASALAVSKNDMQECPMQRVFYFFFAIWVYLFNYMYKHHELASRHCILKLHWQGILLFFIFEVSFAIRVYMEVIVSVFLYL